MTQWKTMSFIRIMMTVIYMINIYSSGYSDVDDSSVNDFCQVKEVSEVNNASNEYDYDYEYISFVSQIRW